MEPFGIGMAGLGAAGLATFGAFGLAFRQRRKRLAASEASPAAVAAASRPPAKSTPRSDGRAARGPRRPAGRARPAARGARRPGHRAPEERLQAMAGQLLGLIRDKNATLETEVLCKVGLVAPGKFHARGFHPTAICSTFGAAAAAGRLYGLTLAQWVDAFGLCGSQSSGIIEYLADGTWTKRLHPGWSSHGGVIATLLAKEGFRGPAKVFEGINGFFPSFGGQNDYRYEKITELGKIWEIPRLTFKSYPCGSISHPYMDCALRIKQKHSPSPARIKEVVCRTAQGPVHRLWEPLADKQKPISSYGAKFSLPYSIAVMLVHGRAGLEEFTDEAIHDAEVLRASSQSSL